MCARDDTCHSQIKPTLPRFLHSLDSLGSSGFCGCLWLSHCHFSTTPLILLCLEISSSSKNFNYTRFFHFHNNINLFLKKNVFYAILFSLFNTSNFTIPSFFWVAIGLFEWLSYCLQYTQKLSKSTTHHWVCVPEAYGGCCQRVLQLLWTL